MKVSVEHWSCPWWRVVEREGIGGRPYFTAERHTPETVHIVALTDADQIVFVHQHRVPFEARVWELPAGLADVDGESLADVAVRELLEETGYSGDAPVELFRGTISPGLSNEMYTLYRVDRARKVASGGGDAHEDMTVHLIPRRNARAWLLERVRAGELVDTKIGTALWLVDA